MTNEQELISSEVSHENPLYAEPIFNIGNFSVTNSLISAWISLIIALIIVFSLRGKIKKIPRGFQNALEIIIEWFWGVANEITGDRKKSIKFLPIVLSFFFFILINNWLGLIPGVGSIGKIVVENGQKVFIPFLRGATADLNTVLALALVGLTIVHIFGNVANGFWNYLNRFVNIKVILSIPKKIIKNPAILIIAPVKVFVGIVEIIGEVSKMASLSFRLFGNIFAGEVLITAISAMCVFLAPLPFMALEVMVGLIQALIFAILIFVYLSISTAPDHEEE